FASSIKQALISSGRILPPPPDLPIPQPSPLRGTAARASSSHRLFHLSSAWPFTFRKRTSWIRTSRSNSCHKSRFSTGSFLLFNHPFFSHFSCHRCSKQLTR